MEYGQRTSTLSELNAIARENNKEIFLIWKMFQERIDEFQVMHTKLIVHEKMEMM